MIQEDEFISISHLRDNTSTVVKKLPQVGKQIILSNNKPVGVFLSIESYNKLKKSQFPVSFMTAEEKTALKESSHGKDSVEALNFLKNLH